MIDLLSYKSRPMSVLFPSSTLPAVMKRKISMSLLKISVLLPVLHRCFRHLIVNAGLSALADFGGDDFIDDLVQRICFRFYGSRASHVAHGAVANFLFYDFVTLIDPDKRGEGNQLALVLDTLAFVRKINGRKFHAFAADIIPDVEFCPVADGECPDIFPFLNPAVVDIPKLRTLAFWIPLSEFIAD